METSFEVLKDKASKVKWFFCDIDGTLTDGCVYYSPKGELLKKFSFRDGTGFFLLKQVGINVGFITTECSSVVKKRAEKLKIDKYIYGTHHKVETMAHFLKENNLSWVDIAFIGDDINDVKLLKAVGLSFAVGNANPRAKDSADVILQNDGGKGAFREAVEKLLGLKGVDVDEIIELYL